MVSRTAPATARSRTSTSSTTGETPARDCLREAELGLLQVRIKESFIYCNLVKVLILHTFGRIMLGVGVRESMLHINVKIRLLHIKL